MERLLLNNMISKKLNNLFLISIPIFVAHGLEEYLAKFYETYPILNFTWTNRLFQAVPQATFLTFQVMFWLLITVMYILLRRDRGTLVIMTIVGFIYIYEATHILSAIIMQRYTPGLITAPLLPIVGFFYWKELMNNWRRSYERK